MGTTTDKLNAVLSSKTAIKNAIVAKGVAVPDNTPLSDYASKISSITSGSGGSPTFTPWVRPTEFLTLASNIDGVEKISILIGLDNIENILAFSLVCDGSYNVDWGDNNTESIISGEVAHHIYDYNNSYLNSDTLLNYGFKQTIVTITGTNITKFDLQYLQKSVVARNNRLNVDSSGIKRKLIKSININLPYCTELILSVIILNNSVTSIYKLAGIYDIKIGEINNITSYSYLFHGLENVRKITFEKPVPSNVNNYNFMCYNCTKLEILPITDFIGSSISCYSVYYFCDSISGNYNINIIGDTATSTISGSNVVFSNMFYRLGYNSKIPLNMNIYIEFNSSYSLNSFMYDANIYDLNMTFGGTGKITSISKFAYGTKIYETIPFDDSLCTDYSGSYNNCRNLIHANAIYDLSNAISINGFYTNCYNLKSIAHPFILSNKCLSFSGAFEYTNITEPIIIQGDLSNASVGPLYSGTNCELYTFDITCKNLNGIFSNTHQYTNVIRVINSKIRVSKEPNANVLFGSWGSTSLNIARFQCDIDFSFNIRNAYLEVNELNEMFEALPTVVGKIVTITENPGIGGIGYDPTIATNKGWTVIA